MAYSCYCDGIGRRLSIAIMIDAFGMRVVKVLEKLDLDKRPINKQEFEQAFDEMAQFLFEQYKKKKQAEEIEELTEGELTESID